MMDPEVTEAADETPSEDAPDETETPSEDEAQAEEEEPADEPADEAESEEDGAPPEGDPALVNLEKKFAHIKDPEQRRVAVAKAYWEKTNYASRTRRENETLKRRLAEIESRVKEPEKPKEPPPPAPELEALDKRIQDLYAKDQATIKEADGELVKLNDIDTEIAKTTARLEDAKAVEDETKVMKLELKLENQTLKKETILRRYQDLLERRRSHSYDYERLNRDREWLERVLKEEVTRQETKKQELEAFNAEFPEKVDSLIEASGQRLGLSDHLIEILIKEVNDGLTVDLLRLGDTDLDEVDIPDLVKARIDRFMQTRDLSSRARFKEKSAAKARVATTPGKTPEPAGPTSTRKPVTPASIQAVELGPKMRKAREYLISKGY